MRRTFVFAIFAMAAVAGACGGDAGPTATVDRFYEAFNAGEYDDVVSLLAADVSAEDNWGTIDLEAELAKFTAQGATYGPASCDVTEETGGAATVVCTHEMLDALTQAVDATPISLSSRFVVESSGISHVGFTYGNPDFTHAGLPFIAWLDAHRPDVNCLAFYADDGSCTEASSLEEIRAEARLVAQYAQEWAAYLEEHDCGYLDGC